MVAVPLARLVGLVGLGSIIGYLGAGIAIGPWGLKLVTSILRGAFTLNVHFRKARACPPFMFNCLPAAPSHKNAHLLKR